MESATTSILVKSNRPPKRFPKIGEMVRVDGRKGLFVVKGVDWVLGTVDLMQRVGNREVFEAGVPCKVIGMVPRRASRAIRQFLSSDLVKSDMEQAIGREPFEGTGSQQTH